MIDVFEAAPDGELPRRMRDATLAALRALGGNARIDAIRRWVLANGAFASSELTRPAPRAPGRLVDHELLLALTNLRREGLVDDQPCAWWALADAPTASAVPAAGRADADSRLAELRAMPYADYLQTSDWLRTRAAALERAGGCCRVDARHREHLDVHHRSHERLGAEFDADLVVLCRSCHLLYHRAYGLARREDAVADAPAPRPAATSRASMRLVLARLPFC